MNYLHIPVFAQAHCQDFRSKNKAHAFPCRNFVGSVQVRDSFRPSCQTKTDIVFHTLIRRERHDL